ncbi:PREDICTED: uncharacterized protein LOC105588034 [Cercocebus atys]|uniref:uncharacterized protein LOC105588034 n=1 Tax=Cercocebus atys TaxID=9531 RepID=UPI0005F40889|nr:PREDICTED: uncharacterized protein LOC105588034 [Cercocebus atys]
MNKQRGTFSEVSLAQDPKRQQRKPKGNKSSISGTEQGIFQVAINHFKIPSLQSFKGLITIYDCQEISDRHFTFLMDCEAAANRGASRRNPIAESEERLRTITEKVVVDLCRTSIHHPAIRAPLSTQRLSIKRARSADTRTAAQKMGINNLEPNASQRKTRTENDSKENESGSNSSPRNSVTGIDPNISTQPRNHIKNRSFNISPLTDVSLQLPEGGERLRGIFALKFLTAILPSAWIGVFRDSSHHPWVTINGLTFKHEIKDSDHAENNCAMLHLDRLKSVQCGSSKRYYCKHKL